ncbi:MAG: hypothetical protein V4642_11115 [Bacteroidota bacterium]
MKSISTFLFIFLLKTISLSAQCTERLLLDGKEDLTAYGMDTTQHWWAITTPFSERYRLTVDSVATGVYSQILPPVFSPDGNVWATFAFENQQYFLLKKDTALPLNCTEVQQIFFSADSRIAGVAVRVGTEDVIRFAEREIRTTNRFGKVYISPGGERVAYTVQRGTQSALFVNFTEVAQMEEIKPIGFWNDGEFLYAGRSGKQWTVFKNKKELSGMAADIGDVAVNATGTVAAAVVKLFNGRSQLLIFSDEYYEPLKGKEYDGITDLVLHPQLALAVFKATLRGVTHIVQNTAEYAGGTITGKPQYSSDGKDVFFAGEDNDSFINMNGQRFSLKNRIAADGAYAFAPGKKSIAFASSSTLVVQNFEKETMRAGLMVDQVISPRYNRFLKRYETLGRINQRLYLISCPVQ